MLGIGRKHCKVRNYNNCFSLINAVRSLKAILCMCGFFCCIHQNREELDRQEFLGIFLSLSEINQVFSFCVYLCVCEKLLGFSMVLL